MKRGGRVLVLAVLSGLLADLGSAARMPGPGVSSPYQGITDRNVFGLRPPASMNPVDVAKPDVPDLNLTGITTILGNKRALLLIPAKPPQRPKEQSLILTEGQSESDVEVLTIDDAAGTVKVNNHGTIQTLDFEKNGLKLAGGPAPGRPGMPGQMMPGMRQISTFRPMRSPYSPPPPPQGPTGGAPNNEGANNYNGNNYGGNNYGGNNYASGQQGVDASAFNRPGNGVTYGPSYGLTGDEQSVLIEANRAKLIEQGRGAEANMLPPTDLTPAPGQPLLPQ